MKKITIYLELSNGRTCVLNGCNKNAWDTLVHKIEKKKPVIKIGKDGFILTSAVVSGHYEEET